MERLFELQKNKTTVKTEIVAGITTFLAAMYIIVVNPAILSQTGMSFNALVTATVLVSAFSSIAMGIYANNPILVAPGMGLNAYFAYSVVKGMGVPWSTALGAVFWSGVIFVLLSVFNVRTLIVKAIPQQIRFGVAAGIGLFITLIGLVNAGFVVNGAGTPVSRGALAPGTLTFLAGLFITSILVSKRMKGALILGIALTTLLAVPIGRWWGAVPLVVWKGALDTPDFSLFFRLDILGSLKLSLFGVIFALLFTDMFDSLSTFVGVAEAGDLKGPDGEPRNIRESLIVDGASTLISGLFGTSPGTSYIESAAGIEEGGRTGLTAVVSGLLFLPFLFLAPLLSVVPPIATAPALVLVGVFMMRPVIQVNWNAFDDAIPAFLAMVLIPLTYSITQGIIWGFLSWTVVKFALGKREQIPTALWVIDVFCIVALIV